MKSEIIKKMENNQIGSLNVLFSNNSMCESKNINPLKIGTRIKSKTSCENVIENESTKNVFQNSKVSISNFNSKQSFNELLSHVKPTDYQKDRENIIKEPNLAAKPTKSAILKSSYNLKSNDHPPKIDNKKNKTVVFDESVTISEIEDWKVYNVDVSKTIDRGGAPKKDNFCNIM